VGRKQQKNGDVGIITENTLFAGSPSRYYPSAMNGSQPLSEAGLLPQIKTTSFAGYANVNNAPKRATSSQQNGIAASYEPTLMSYSHQGKDLHNNLLIVNEELAFGAVTSIKGLKPGNPNWINQDNFFLVENFDGRDVRLYCVLDGHGENGHLVSRRCRDNFPHFIKSTNLQIDQAFNMMQNDLNSSDIDARCSGATCVVASIISNRLTVYNCGDSRAVLARRLPNGSIAAHPLSNDHKPDKPEERKRILGCGGHLGCRQVLVNQGNRRPVSMPVGPCRVWYQHRGETLGLAMSRSLGDSIAHKVGVTAEPEVIDHMIDDYDEFLLIATDGVWDVVDNNYALTASLTASFRYNRCHKCHLPPMHLQR
jgi:serine/threonine protein phosphatase PrpC